MSNYSLNRFELEVLGFGLNFALPANRSNFPSFVKNLSFLKNDSQIGFLSSFLGPIFNDLSSSHQAFPKRYLKALASLRNNSMIHISPADKGGKIVIMNSSDYNKKLTSIFLNDSSTYKKVNFNPLSKMQSEFNKQLKNLSLKYPDSKNFILSFKSFLPSLPYAYGLPKLHKPNCPLRPIISNVNAPAYKLSKTLASILSPYLGSFSSSYLKHSGDLLSKLRILNLTPSDRFISFDAVSLFTNVPLDPTLEFLSRKLPSIKPSLPVSVPCLLDLIRITTSHCFFSFNGLFFQQIFGFAMGNPLSPVLSNFFLEHVESELLPKFSGSKPFFFVRYVDDILAAVHSDFDLTSFLCFVNSLYPSLKFSFEWESNLCIPFLDVLIIRSLDTLKFKVFRKSTHSNNYLHYLSFHSQSIKISVAQNLFLRAFRICSSDFLNEEINYIFSSFSKLAYPDFILKKALRKARCSFFRPTTRPKFKGSTVSVPYVPALDSPFQSKLAASFNCRTVFSYPNKIKSLVSSNAPKPLFQKGVYRIDCKNCDKFYIGETGRSLNKRIIEHKNDILNHNLNNSMFVHSLDNNHSFNFNEAKIIIPCNDLPTRKITESSLINFHHSSIVNIHPGLNQINSYVSHLLLSCYHPRFLDPCASWT